MAVWLNCKICLVSSESKPVSPVSIQDARESTCSMRDYRPKQMERESQIVLPPQMETRSQLALAHLDAGR